MIQVSIYEKSKVTIVILVAFLLLFNLSSVARSTVNNRFYSNKIVSNRISLNIPKTEIKDITDNKINNNELYVSPNDIDLGSHKGGTAFQTMFTVKNIGRDTLQISLEQMVDIYMNVSLQISPRNFHLLPNESEVVQVYGRFPTFGPLKTGIEVKSNKDNESVYIHGNVLTSTEVNVKYKGDWHTVGIPVDIIANSPDSLFKNIIPATIYGFSDRYVIPDAIIPGKGYWMRFKNDTSITFIGPKLSTADWKLKKGWNMVSGPSTKAPFIVSDYNPPIQSIWGYDGGYQQADTLVPGYGYWVYSNINSTVTVPKQQAKQTVVPSAAANTTTNQDMKLQSKDQAPPITLIVKDAAGHQMQLMVDGSQANGTSVPNRYLMPPLPPSGMFDARFSTGYQMANGKDAKIDMQGMKNGGSFSFSSKNDQTRLQLVISDPTGQNNADKILSPGQVYTLPSQSKISVRVHVTSVQEIKASLPKQFVLKQNYPNPFNPTTTIRYGLPEKANVQLTVYNILGQKVETLVSGSQKAGWHQVRFDAHQLSSGLYIYRLVAGNYVMVKKLMLVK